MFKSQIVAHHIKRRTEGFFTSPRHELFEVNRILEQEDLNRAEKSWAFQRRKKLIEQIYYPSVRFLIYGTKPGGIPTHDVTQEQRKEIKMREEIIQIQDLLDKP